MSYGQVRSTGPTGSCCDQGNVGSMTATQQGTRQRDFAIKVMGRTLEHLGVQMYKRRDAALAELVANAWDAGANRVEITLPSAAEYHPGTASITVADDGSGMSEDAVENGYLIIGRNRRADGQPEPSGRRVMGRKGIGKLAGFGLAKRMQVSTWCDGELTQFELNSEALKTEAGQVANVAIRADIGPVPEGFKTSSGTSLSLSNLKHKTPLDPAALRWNLARRFSRTVLGRMEIIVNGERVVEPSIDFEIRDPESGEHEEELADGNIVRWWAGFSRTVLQSEMQGLTILVRGKTAQAPPFFFNVESTASGQHGTKYLTGVIEADYLDDGVEDSSDKISTDRQEIDWADEATGALNTWGGELVRRLLRLRRDQRGANAALEVEHDPQLASRIEHLDRPSRDRVYEFVNKLGGADTESDKIKDLADTVVRVYEYRHFHDYIEQLDEIADDPDLLIQTLEYMRGWKVVEGRAILEIVKGRIDILDKFYSMIISDAPETAPFVGADNMHDLIADYPWLINPEWQVLAEERSLTRQLQEWGTRDIPDEERGRYDFLALAGENSLVVIEIKRSGHPVEFKDLQQVERYADVLGQGRSNIRMVVITGDRYAISESRLAVWRDREDIDLLTWRDIYERARKFYDHYRAVLEGDVEDDSFDRKQREVARTRSILDTAAYRGPSLRKEGLGPQDVDLEAGSP